jgi:hypothetical protein
MALVRKIKVFDLQQVAISQDRLQRRDRRLLVRRTKMPSKRASSASLRPIGFSPLIGCFFIILEQAVNPESAKDSVRYPLRTQNKRSIEPKLLNNLRPRGQICCPNRATSWTMR